MEMMNLLSDIGVHSTKWRVYVKILVLWHHNPPQDVVVTTMMHVHFAAEKATIEPEPESEEGVFYIDGQGYKKFGQPQGNFSGNRFTGN